MDLKNIKIEDLKDKLSTIDKKTLIKFGIGFGSIIVFLIIYYAILNPMVDERKAKFSEFRRAARGQLNNRGAQLVDFFVK